MTDIVERLRDPSKGSPRWLDTLNEAADEIERLRLACTKMNTEVCQSLGKALGYPWFKDDQTNFPGATEENGVCTGDHVAESIANEAADEIERLRNALREIAEGGPKIPLDDNGEGPDWPMQIYAMKWASFSSELQSIARNALKENDQ